MAARPLYFPTSPSILRHEKWDAAWNGKASQACMLRSQFFARSGKDHSSMGLALKLAATQLRFVDMAISVDKPNHQLQTLSLCRRS